MLIIIGCFSFMTSIVSLAVALYTKYTLEARLTANIAKDLYAAKEELIGIEHRLEALMDKKLNASNTHMRELAQNDAVDLVEAVISKQGGMPNEGMGMASFNNIGR